MKAKIKDKKEVAKRTLRVAFDLLGEKVDFQAGQIFHIQLIDPPYEDKRGSNRHITIVNPPEDNEELVLTTRIRESAFKKSLDEMPIGSDVEVGGISGDFLLPESTERPLVFLAGGIGITPFMSMLAHIKNKNLPYKITLFCSNRDTESTAYKKELEKWAQEIHGFKLILTMTQESEFPGEKRRIDEQFLQEYLPNPLVYLYYIAGPPRFTRTMKEILQNLRVEQENIKTEDFSGY